MKLEFLDVLRYGHAGGIIKTLVMRKRWMRCRMSLRSVTKKYDLKYTQRNLLYGKGIEDA